MYLVVVEWRATWSSSCELPFLSIITSKHKIKIFLRASSNFIDLKLICFFSFAVYYFFVDCTQLRTSKLLESYSSAGDDCIFGYSSGIQIPFCRLVPQRSVQKWRLGFFLRRNILGYTNELEEGGYTYENAVV